MLKVGGAVLVTDYQSPSDAGKWFQLESATVRDFASSTLITTTRELSVVAPGVGDGVSYYRALGLDCP